MEFPDKLEDFINFVKGQDIETPSQWVGAKEYDKLKVIEFFFLWSVWQAIENPDNCHYSAVSIEAHKKWAKARGRRLDPDMSIVEKLLNLGATPEDIEKLVQIKQSEIAAWFLYHLDDPNSYTDFDSDDYNSGYFVLENEGEGTKNVLLQGMHETFYCAKPKSMKW